MILNNLHLTIFSLIDCPGLGSGWRWWIVATQGALVMCSNFQQMKLLRKSSADMHNFVPALQDFISVYLYGIEVIFHLQDPGIWQFWQLFN